MSNLAGAGPARKATATRPGGATIVSDKYICGYRKSTTGTAVVPTFVDITVNSDGLFEETTHTAADNGPRYVRTVKDGLKRVVKTESPAFGGGTIVSVNSYDDKGRLVKTSRTGLADTIYVHDDLGNLVRSGLDVNGDGALSPASMDRITDSETIYSSENGAWFQVSTSTTYPKDNDSTAVTTSVSKRQLTNLPSGTIQKVINTDVFGNQTVSTTTLDRDNKTVTQTTDVPDSTVDAVSTTVNGLLTSSTTPTNLTYTYSYDALGRRVGVTDPRVGTSTTAYYSSGAGKIGKVQSRTNANGNTTTFDYDPNTGLRTKVTNALGKDTIYAYNLRGQVETVTGDATYPIAYVYDSYGALAELHTFRSVGVGTSTSDSSQSAELTPDASDITTWTYDNATGLLTAKTDASGKSVTYTYDNANRLATRTWARGIATTYSYNPSTGELVSVDYSDTTPDISYTYNRVGQQKTVVDAVGTRTFAYNDKMQLTSESINGIYSKVIERSYSTTGYKGRYVGMNIGSEYDVDYGYDGYGRFSTVASGSDVFAYNYLANSNLVESVAYPNDISVVNTYEPHRNLITSVENKHGSATISKYSYANDQLGRRVSMGKSGTAFNQADTISYGYNDRNEVVSAVSANDAAYNYGFDFDTIGNRISASSANPSDPSNVSYTSNSLNQYTQISTPQGATLPTYDPDGDMLSITLNSGNWTNAFNAENRIVSMETADKKLEFVYDYMGRRVEKKVYSGSTDNWSLITDNYYVYDGYEQIEKLDALNSNAIRNKRVWSDGKILCDIRDGVAYYALGDANKNITDYVDASGSVQAHYEYSPFGKIAKSNGAMEDDFDYRFSSEVYDGESGLVYYNYRYYSAELGRWLSRDPIEEEGGYNLYAMVGNDAVGGWDELGITRVTSMEIESYHPFKVTIKYEELPACCEINIIQWKYDLGRQKWMEDPAGNAPFYYDYSQRDSAARWDKEHHILTFEDMPGGETVFIFIVVEVCKESNGDVIATVLATRTWSSKEGPWGFWGVTAHQNEYRNVYEDMIKKTSEEERSSWDFDRDMNPIETNKHKVRIVIPSPSRGEH